MRLRVFVAGLLASLVGPSPADASPGFDPVVPGSPAVPDDQDSAPPDASREGRGERSDPTESAARGPSEQRLAGVRHILEAAYGHPASGFLLTPWDELVLAAYAEEVSQQLGGEAGEPIAHLLASLPPTERTWLIARWTLSERDAVRLALARGAAYPFHAVGLYSALAQLAIDRNPQVRSAACAALVRRGATPPAPATAQDPAGTLDA